MKCRPGSGRHDGGVLLVIGLWCGFIFCGILGDSVEVIELGSKWSITNQNGSLSIANQSLPSGIYSAFGAQVLESYNDINLRWLAYDNWTYTNKFQFDIHHYQRGHINLTFHGIDTIAEIRLNHQLLGRTDNMFVRYSYDVSSILQQENILEVEIVSPVWTALAKAQALDAAQRSVPPACPHERYNGECHMNMLRKMQSSFAWDWGLAAPSMGLWKNVQLEIYEVAVIRDIDVDISRTANGSHWNMHIRCYLDAVGRQNFYGTLILYAVELLDHPVVVDTYTSQPISYLTPIIEFDQAVPTEKVATWWPNGYGDQKLYPLHFTLKAWLGSKGPEVRSKTKSQKSLRVGFRTLELVEVPAPDGLGNTFLFRVNGLEIFMKGSNYIPSHILPENQTNDRIEHLLKSAKEAHMNMLRVWGGGVYESDYFYNLADSLGLLIWQDMMFACAMYPVGEEYLSSVREEVRQNAKRLSHHPSIAIFVTNNENEAALVNDWYHTIYDEERFKAEYRELYVANVIHELKLVSHKSRPQPLVSSPSNGKASAMDNYISENPQDDYYGDVHFYDYLKDGWDPGIYPTPRFASEYGFQSFPSFYSWQRSKNDDDDLAALMNHRQHHPLGSYPIKTLVERHLPLPLPEAENYAEALIYFSQISQAMATKVETELYRSLRDTAHNTMGALYWQLNDVWVAPSWSGIDFYGNWKLLHYWARDFLAPIAIVAQYDKTEDSLNIILICDEPQVDTEGLTVVANKYLWSQLLPRDSINWTVTLRPNGVQYDKVIPIKDLLVEEFNTRNAFLELQLRRRQEVLSRTYFFPSNIAAAVGLEDPGLEYDIASRTCLTTGNVIRNSLSISIQVKRPAVFVYLELLKPYQYLFSENGYMQTTPVHVVYLTFDATSCVRLRKSEIKVLTVNDFMP
ncbi:beta-mannosidase [Drosophila pseudoobscura]|uniref:beta-mannosidase n=1 Tax=Drosophila pseudoobscura pseudoobscura TaxID=46245 RepID=A0A6I8URA5_DROPS|nr:beta-mannosidase [Drosophila pseudoobscura]